MSFEQCAPDKQKIDVIIPHAVLHFVLSGEGYINGKKITKNTVFISFEESRMNYYPSPANPWSYIYVRLDGADVKKAFLDHGFNLGLTIVPFDKIQALFQIMSLNQHFMDVENPDASKLIANFVFLLFEKCNSPLLHKSKQQQHVDNIKRFIDENYYKKISMEEVSEKFYLNRNYIRTLFVKYLEVSPKQYLQSVRMERAKFMLTNTEESITLIANSVGYEDTLLFSKMFKKYTAVSPQKYRADRVNQAECACNVPCLMKGKD